ncbi:unnamed protein product [marine sediment metagenome]|uniref:Uncharacterized protein n=1 Tax=marine sediment metagenome TaxID=412755 RepID=X0RGF3_9ZZZZ
MKPKNFPARKLLRSFWAEGVDINTPEAQKQLDQARTIRTKKNREKK